MKYALYILPLAIAFVIIWNNNSANEKRIESIVQELDSVNNRMLRMQDRQNNLILEVSTLLKGQR